MYNYIICIYITLETSGGLLSILWLLSCEGCLFYNSSWISPPAACPASWMKEETKPQHLYRHQALFASLYLASALLSREEPFWMHWIYFISTLKWVCRGVLYPVDTHKKILPIIPSTWKLWKFTLIHAQVSIAACRWKPKDFVLKLARIWWWEPEKRARCALKSSVFREYIWFIQS